MINEFSSVTMIPFPWKVAPWWCVWELYKLTDYVGEVFHSDLARMAE